MKASKVFLFILFFLVGFYGTKALAAGCYSEGIRKGDIQKFSVKGVFTKSWEGEMVQEGIRTKQTTSGSAGLTNIWKFSVTDPAVATKINDAIFAGGPVTVKYCQSLFVNRLETNTSYIVTDAKASPK